ncbi:hypothetical protein B0T14DRAFT_604565 [Immersiella caudata]|uniref:PLD phosphodiesterase domain-containing protein n=1 Tax=Immersiella caudata TaxID=314043 RepID=A0AA39WIV0_9PEZI|nr:hypothetical protein B0T14DRAFT_604565 [Immersiella caudata]
MPTIKDIYNTIKNGDGLPERFHGLAYGITLNDSVGLPDGFPFLTVSPFGHVPTSDADYAEAVSKYGEGVMPIQNTFKKVLTEGYKLSQDQTTLFIDIADLDDDFGNTVFLTEGGNNSIAHSIIELIKHVPDNFTPVIRFLRGTHQSVIDVEKFWETRRLGIEAMFWEKAANGKDLVPLIKHANAEFHVGYYSPNMVLTTDQQSVYKPLIKFIGNLASAWSPEEADATLDTIFKNLAFSASWNHGKIVAIGGKTMMTGGINYWPDYIGHDNVPPGHPERSTRGRIIDMQATVTGDAAASAQGGYLDYFWNYLSLPKSGRPSDHRSFHKSIKLSANPPAPDQPLPWSPSTQVPLFKTAVKHTPRTTGGIPILSVARVGDWGGPTVAAYPPQAIDALRDLALNKKIPALVGAGKFAEIITSIKEASDDSFKARLLNLAGYSPATWASDTARISAIRSAKSTVYTSGQMLVGALQRSDDSYKEMVRTTNKDKPNAQWWDGFLWPYDLLLAFATVILRLRDTKKDAASHGIRIVLGNIGDKGPGSWDDERSVGDVRSKIVPLLRGLDTKLTDAEAAALVGSYLEIRRIGKPWGAGGPNSIHTKTICVDEELLYVGSDNLYPSYNEEHGIWVDDKPAVQGWIKDYWNVLWVKYAKVVKEGSEDLKVSQFSVL